VYDSDAFIVGEKMQRQFTATVFIIHDHKILLIFHKKLKKWLPPGGHLEPNELPCEAAIREAYEETGLKIDLIQQENIWIERRPNSKSFERPYLCLLENIPETENEPAHQHIDFIYLGHPVGGSEILNIKEIEALKWFSWEEILNLREGDEIFWDTREALRNILTQTVQSSLHRNFLSTSTLT
jgi:8-oxo-dGTP pyrophosphatase MutT (NUDIX family)